MIDEILDSSRLEAGQVTYNRTVQSSLNLSRGERSTASTGGGERVIPATGVVAGVKTGPRRGSAKSSSGPDLVGNALKFTDSGSVTVSLEGQLGWPSDKELELVRFEVKDTGVGIAEDQQQQLFEAFTQVDESISRGQGDSAA